MSEELQILSILNQLGTLNLGSIRLNLGFEVKRARTTHDEISETMIDLRTRGFIHSEAGGFTITERGESYLSGSQVINGQRVNQYQAFHLTLGVRA